MPTAAERKLLVRLDFEDVELDVGLFVVIGLVADAELPDPLGVEVVGDVLLLVEVTLLGGVFVTTASHEVDEPVGERGTDEDEGQLMIRMKMMTEDQG